MPVATKAIKRRITSVKNTRKITKAMELVAASKMRRAVEAALGTRSYAQYAWEVLQHIAASPNKEHHALLAVQPVSKVLMILVTSNRGLCGGLNANVIKKAIELIREPHIMALHRLDERTPAPKRDLSVELITVGKKGERSVGKLGVPVIASFVDFSDTPTFAQVQPIAQMVIDAYTKKQYEKVVVVFSDFVSVLTQRPKVRQILPISPMDLEKMILEIKRLADEPLMGSDGKSRWSYQEDVKAQEFVYEPNPQHVLDVLLPRLVEVQLFQSVLESSASEHSARMLAMRNASSAAKDMIEDLVFTLNRARQAGITQEIAEISSGMSAIT